VLTLRRELGVLTRTFIVAWLVLAALLCAAATLSGPPTPDALQEIAVGFVISLFYTFWPALVVAAIRLTFRVAGPAAFVPVPVLALGIAGALWLFEAWLDRLLRDVLAAAIDMGPCAAHTGYPFALVCMGIALLYPGGLYAVGKLVLGVLLVLMLGSLPGCVLGLALLVRALRRRLEPAVCEA